MSQSPPLLQARHVQWSRGQQRVLHDIQLQLHSGERLGLLGLNGAGKTSLLRVLAGLQPPDGGTVCLNGKNLYQQPGGVAQLSLVPDQPPQPSDMTVSEWLYFCARMQGMNAQQARQARQRKLKHFQLQVLADCSPNRLSRGQLQRLSLARALLQQPAVLLLDEPSNGLDPVQAAALRNLLLEHLGDTGLILASHLAEDLALCQRVLLLADGRIQAEIPAQQLAGHALHTWLEGLC